LGVKVPALAEKVPPSASAQSTVEVKVATDQLIVASKYSAVESAEGES